MITGTSTLSEMRRELHDLRLEVEALRRAVSPAFIDGHLWRYKSEAEHPLHDLDLSIRCVGAIRHGIGSGAASSVTLEDLVFLRRPVIASIRGVSPAAMKKIDAAMVSAGLTWAPE